MEKITRHRIARKTAPIMKVPVKSTRTPIMRGPVNPPISATQKNIPPAYPMYLVSTSGLSIKIRIIRGIREELTKPNKINPVNRKVPVAFTTITRVNVVSKAKTPMKRPLKDGGTSRGIIKRSLSEFTLS